MLEVRNWAMHKITSIPMLIPEKWVKQQYLPDKLRGVNYFQPNETGKYEKSSWSLIKDRIDKLSR